MRTELNKHDPLKRQEDVSSKDRGSEYSPMNPPEAYNPPCIIKVDYKEFHPVLQRLVDEHNDLKGNLLLFENMLNELQKNSGLGLDLKNKILNFLDIFEHDFTLHNKQEEKHLFPLLSKRFLEIGEHSKAKNPITPIHVLEDEHREATKIATEAHYIWTLVFKISNPAIHHLLLKEFLIKSLKLIEIVRLHIFREDDIVFSLAQKNLTKDELDLIFKNF